MAPQTGVRDVACDPVHKRNLVTLSVKGVVQSWDVSTMQVQYTEPLRKAVEPVCLYAAEHLAAVGLLTRIALLDLRVRGPYGKISGMRAGNGVRSVSIQGNLLTAGYCNGQVAFYDLRTFEQMQPTCLTNNKKTKSRQQHVLQTPAGWGDSTWCGASVFGTGPASTALHTPQGG